MEHGGGFFRENPRNLMSWGWGHMTWGICWTLVKINPQSFIYLADSRGKESKLEKSSSAVSAVGFRVKPRCLGDFFFEKTFLHVSRIFAIPKATLQKLVSSCLFEWTFHGNSSQSWSSSFHFSCEWRLWHKASKRSWHDTCESQCCALAVVFLSSKRSWSFPPSDSVRSDWLQRCSLEAQLLSWMAPQLLREMRLGNGKKVQGRSSCNPVQINAYPCFLSSNGRNVLERQFLVSF